MLNLPHYIASRSIRPSSPNQRYLEQKQAQINTSWDNSTQNGFDVLMQSEIGSNIYIPVDVSVDMAIDMGTGLKQGDDFKTFSHRDISYNPIKGIMYQYESNYWIVTNTSKLASPTSSSYVRRCNNTLKWIDAETGALFEVPCAIDYELSSPSPQRDKDIVVANGHCLVICQGNDKTLNLEKNQRFILNGQPFKLAAMNDLQHDDVEVTESTLMYLDLYLDTIENTDDLVNDIANEDEYPLQPTTANRIEIEPLFDSVRLNESLSFTATLFLNDVEQTTAVTCVASGVASDYYTLTNVGNVFTLKGLKVSSTPLTLTLSAQNVTRVLTIALKAYF